MLRFTLAATCAIALAWSCGQSASHPSVDDATGSSSGTSNGGSSSNGGGGANVDASGGTCLPSTADAFTTAALLPHFVPIGATPGLPGKTACGSVSLASGTLTLTKLGACAGNAGSARNYVVLDPTAFVLCGDFDVEVAFDLTDFPLPTSDRWAGLRVSTFDSSCWSAGDCPGVSVERFDQAMKDYYKIWNTDPSTGIVPGSDVEGHFRIQRAGATVTAYYGSSGAWTKASTTTAPTSPMAIQLYTGSCSQAPCAAADQVDQTVVWTGLAIGAGGDGGEDGGD